MRRRSAVASGSTRRVSCRGASRAVRDAAAGSASVGEVARRCATTARGSGLAAASRSSTTRSVGGRRVAGQERPRRRRAWRAGQVAHPCPRRRGRWSRARRRGASCRCPAARTGRPCGRGRGWRAASASAASAARRRVPPAARSAGAPAGIGSTASDPGTACGDRLARRSAGDPHRRRRAGRMPFSSFGGSASNVKPSAWAGQVDEVCAGEDLAGGRRGAQPGGQVEGRAAVAVADRDRLAGVEPDAHRERQLGSRPCLVGEARPAARRRTAAPGAPSRRRPGPRRHGARRARRPRPRPPSCAISAKVAARREAASSPCWPVNRV